MIESVTCSFLIALLPNYKKLELETNLSHQELRLDSFANTNTTT